MSMFNDISWGSKDNEKECESSAQLVSLYAKRFSPRQWSFLGPGSEKKWSSTHENNPQGCCSLGCESTNLSVERLDKDKDTDEDVNADRVRTVRPVGGQPTGLFTQLEEIDIDFRVSGLPRAVVKQAENFRVRELVRKIESHPHREALQADLQQSDVLQPIQCRCESDDS